MSPGRTPWVAWLLIGVFLPACDEAIYREKLEIRADRSGRLIAELEVSRSDGLFKLIAEAAGQELPLISPERLNAPLPDGLTLVSFEDLSDDERFHYRFVVDFVDVDALRRLDSLLPSGTEGKSSTLFQGLSWEEQGEGRWLYRRQVGDGTMPETAEQRRALSERKMVFQFELKAPDSIDRTNAEKIENRVAHWKVMLKDLINEGGRVVLHAEIAPRTSAQWLMIPVGLAAAFVLWGASRKRPKKRRRRA